MRIVILRSGGKADRHRIEAIVSAAADAIEESL
jgi:hypothetical protein